MNMIATLPTHSPYCQNIRQKKECLKNCTISNLVHMKQASSLNQTVSYTCHAGLMETIIPVTYEDTLIGYMQIGQFRDKEEIFSSPKTAQNLLEKYKINTKTALKLYRDLPIVSAEKLSSLKEILFILIKHGCACLVFVFVLTVIKTIWTLIFNECMLIIQRDIINWSN